MPDRISYHSLSELQSYFEANLKKPFWRRAAGAADEVTAVKMDVKGVAVSFPFTRAFRRFTAGWRWYYASYHWLLPSERPMGLDHLDHLSRACGLDHLKRADFVRTLKEEVESFGRSHPPLDRWVRARAELLSHELEAWGDIRPSSTLLSTRHAVFGLATYLEREPEAVLEHAAQALQAALHGAALAVHAQLGGKATGDLHASLMVPIEEKRHVRKLLECLEPGCDDRFAVAQSLWPAEASYQTHLVVVADTRGRHGGFWVPVRQASEGRPLPGGPAAYVHRTGSMVALDDIPMPKGFSESVSLHWAAYLKDNVAGTLFVSLPWLAPLDGETSRPAAVLNVNGYPPSEDIWYRGYCSEWLVRARDAAAPWVEVAHQAWQLTVLAKVRLRNIPLQLKLDPTNAGWPILVEATTPQRAEDDDDEVEDWSPQGGDDDEAGD